MAAQMISEGEENCGVVERRLVFADVAYQYSVEPSRGAPFVVTLLHGTPDDRTRAMEFVRTEQSSARDITLLGADGSVQAAVQPAEPMATWTGTGFSTEFETFLRASFPPAADRVDGMDPTPLAPLLLLRTHRGVHAHTEVLLCARVRSIGTLFARVGGFDHPAAATEAELIPSALSFADVLKDRIRIEGNAYTTYEQGTEIEQKITLSDEVAIWSLTMGLWTSIEQGEFSEFITDPGYELTRWHFVQENFEIIGPAEEVGHMAFQENPDGKYQLKHKRFREDSLRRTEMFRKGIDVPERDFEGFLAREYPELKFRRLPSFRRTRFDINVQSVLTGHYFGIETDEVTVETDSGRHKLRQVEIEYLETRWHEGMNAASIDTDLEKLTVLVEDHLAAVGITARRNHYSKLSFLRDCLNGTAAQPTGS
ncbi:hypothetical protein B7R87_30310 [Streptomyces tsukubensis]|uniref:Uncharacterized protein n=1 Tax=Streptomyces tsukubensis (strain DSM 42081 / NBRC 108919 / NRRL 18488 / 9993) TaxID=1114943 RepID=A0A7G3UB62_STRT9|nr:hypothetical protein B7R87_30310 [Streptomyces tsukubensis]QKM66360.1 hypothetical protein STSU_003470 [Streptomyces tsukubensis NRRL18488]